MQKKIDHARVKKVAGLSRLELTGAEIAEFASQLSAILGYVEKMNELDTENVQPLAHCMPVINCFRPDCVKQSLGTEAALANAPQRDGQFFKVPRIIDSV